MTISSGTAQTLLLTPAAPAPDGQFSAPPIAIDPGQPGMPAAIVAEGEFWTLVSQSLAEGGLELPLKNNELQELPESISSLMSDIEWSPDKLEQVVVPSEWMEVLKSHFAFSPQVAASDSPEPVAEQPIEMPDVVVAPVPVSPVRLEDVSMETTDGEVLPPVRQGITAAVKAEPEMAASIAVPDRGHSQRPDVAVAVNVATKTPVEKEFAPLMLDEPGSSDKTVANPTPTENRSARNMLPEILLTATRATDLNSAINQVSPTVAPMATVQAPTIPGTTSASQALPPEMQTLQMSQAGNSTQWGDAIGERVAFLINHKLNSAEIRLDPPHLGKLDIQIQVKEDSAVIHINTQQAQTRDLIDNAGQRLREFLQEAGYSSVDVNVSHQEQSAGQFAGSEEGMAEQHGGTRNGEDATASVSEINAVIGRVASDRAIDFYA